MTGFLDCCGFLPLREGRAHRLSWSPNGRYLATPLSCGSYQLWDMKEEEQALFRTHNAEIFSVAWSPDSTQVASCSADGQIVILKLLTLEFRVLIGIPKASWFDLAWSPTGENLAIASSEGQVLLYDVQGQKASAHFESKAAINSVTWNQNGSLLFLCREKGVLPLRTKEDGSIVKELEMTTPTAWHGGCSPTEDIFASAHDDGLRIWPGVNSQEAIPEKISDEPSKAVAFSHDGRILAALARDGELRLWLLKDFSPLASIKTESHSRWQSHAFHPSEKVLAVPDKSGRRVALWNFRDTDSLSIGPDITPKRCDDCPPLSFPPFSRNAKDAPSWTLDAGLGILFRDGVEVNLTALEQRAFVALERSYFTDPGQRLSNKDLCDAIDGYFRSALSGKRDKGLRFKLRKIKLGIEAGTKANPGYRLVDKKT